MFVQGMDKCKLVSFIEKTEAKINKITCSNKQVGPDFERLSSGLFPSHLLILYLSVIVFSNFVFLSNCLFNLSVLEWQNI